MHYKITLTVSEQTDQGEQVLFRDIVPYATIGEILEPWSDCQRVLERSAPISGGLLHKDTVS